MFTRARLLLFSLHTSTHHAFANYANYLANHSESMQILAMFEAGTKFLGTFDTAGFFGEGLAGSNSHHLNILNKSNIVQHMLCNRRWQKHTEALCQLYLCPQKSMLPLNLLSRQDDQPWPAMTSRPASSLLWFWSLIVRVWRALMVVTMKTAPVQALTSTRSTPPCLCCHLKKGWKVSQQRHRLHRLIQTHTDSTPPVRPTLGYPPSPEPSESSESHTWGQALQSSHHHIGQAPVSLNRSKLLGELAVNPLWHYEHLQMHYVIGNSPALLRRLYSWTHFLQKGLWTKQNAHYTTPDIHLGIMRIMHSPLYLPRISQDQIHLLKKISRSLPESLLNDLICNTLKLFEVN